jgi:hypothetical protein
MSYLIVLFKNKIQRRIIKTFVNFNKAKKFFEEKIKESDKIFFHKKFETGKPVSYELAIIGNKSSKTIPIYQRDELGRTIKVELDSDEKEFITIQPYFKEEKLFDVREQEKINVDKFIRKYLNGKVGIKLVSRINHKIIVQNDSNINLFSLKNEDDSLRLMELLINDFKNKKKHDVIFVTECSHRQKSNIYKLLVNEGFDIQALYRQYTTHPSKK